MNWFDCGAWRSKVKVTVTPRPCECDIFMLPVEKFILTVLASHTVKPHFNVWKYFGLCSWLLTIAILFPYSLIQLMILQIYLEAVTVQHCRDWTKVRYASLIDALCSVAGNWILIFSDRLLQGQSQWLKAWHHDVIAVVEPYIDPDSQRLNLT